MINKKWFIILSVVLVAATALLSGCSCGIRNLTELPSNAQLNISNQQSGIWVTGTGEMTVVPDIANLVLGISAQEATVAEAQEQANNAMEAVMNALDDNGIADSDIQTEYFNIYPVTRWDDEKMEEQIIGYRVTNMLSVKIRDVDNTGTIIDNVVAAGGDLIKVNSISFSIDDPSVYYAEIREEAMADAKEKAEQLADLADVTLGKPSHVSENSYTPGVVYPRASYDFEESMSGAAINTTEISPGEMDISITIDVIYTIQ